MKKAGFALAVIVLILLACALAYFVVVSQLDEKIRVMGYEVWLDPKEVTEEVTPLTVCVKVRNDSPFSLELTGGFLTVSISGIDVAHADIPGGQVIGKGVSTFTVKLCIDNSLLGKCLCKHLSNDEKSSIVVRGALKVKCVIGEVTVPVRYEAVIETSTFPVEIQVDKTYKVPLLGKIRVEKAVVSLLHASSSAVTLRVEMLVRNEMRVPLCLNWVTFVVKAEDGKVIGEGEQESPAVIAPGSTGVIAFRAVLKDEGLAHWWYVHLKKKEKSKLIVLSWIKIKVFSRTIELFKDKPVTIVVPVRTNIFNYRG